MRNFGIEYELNYETGTDTPIEYIQLDFIDRFPKEPLNRRNVEYYHSSGNTWDFKADSSVQGRNPFELASPILKFPRDLSRLHAVNQYLEETCTVNSSCGLHLHIQVKDLSMLAILNGRQVTALGKQFLWLMQPLRRAENRYCNFPNVMTINEIKNQMYLTSDLGEYPRDGYNLQHLKRRGTIEIRLGASTTCWEDILPWICFWMYTIAHMKTIENPIESKEMNYTTLKDFFTLAMGDDYPPELYNHYLKTIIDNMRYRLKGNPQERESMQKINNKFLRYLSNNIDLKEYLECAV